MANVRGTGSIYPLRDPSTKKITGYRGAVVAEDGVRKYVRGKTKAEVRDKMDAIREQLRQHLPLATEKLTFQELLDRWLTDFVKPRRAPKTYQIYSQQVKLHIGPALGKYLLPKLTAQIIDRYLNKKLAEGLAPRTVQMHHELIRNVLNKAMDWDLLSRNVATQAERPTARRYQPHVMTRNELQRFLRAIEGHRLEALWYVMVADGLRPAEAFGLQWSRVDLETGEIRVTHALKRVEGKLQPDEQKTEASRRVLPLPPMVVERLRAHKGRQLLEELAAEERWKNEHDLVFTYAEGTPLLERNVVRDFHLVLGRANLPDMRLYDLRHACGTFLAALNVHPRIAMAILGHSSIKLTMETYSHALDEDVRDAAGRMDGLLRGGN